MFQEENDFLSDKEVDVETLMERRDNYIRLNELSRQARMNLQILITGKTAWIATLSAGTPRGPTAVTQLLSDTDLVDFAEATSEQLQTLAAKGDSAAAEECYARLVSLMKDQVQITRERIAELTPEQHLHNNMPDSWTKVADATNKISSANGRKPTFMRKLKKAFVDAFESGIQFGGGT